MTRVLITAHVTFASVESSSSLSSSCKGSCINEGMTKIQKRTQGCDDGTQGCDDDTVKICKNLEIALIVQTTIYQCISYIAYQSNLQLILAQLEGSQQISDIFLSHNALKIRSLTIFRFWIGTLAKLLVGLSSLWNPYTTSTRIPGTRKAPLPTPAFQALGNP